MDSLDSLSNTFFGATTENQADANLIAIGIPWDVSSSFRRGAAKGPLYIRQATSSRLYNPFSETKVNIANKWHIYDYGDIALSEKNAVEARDEVFRVVKQVWEERKWNNCVFLGGDHLITYFSFYSLMQLEIFQPGDVGIIYLDSHPDLYDEYEDDEYSHACVMRRIIDHTEIQPSNIVQVGIRAPTPEQLDYANQIGITIIPGNKFQKIGPLKTVTEIRNQFKNKVDHVYLSIDLDVLDPAFAPGIGNPQPGGVSTREIIDLLHTFSELPLFAMDIVELCPKYDQANLTGFVAAKFLLETLGIMN